MGSYRLLEHTADVGIEARAATGEELFRQAALALYEVLGLTAEGGREESREVDLAAGDREELLVAWLSEILYLLETERFVVREVRLASLEPFRLRGTLSGESCDPDHCRQEREIKAVTYHRLQVTDHCRQEREIKAVTYHRLQVTEGPEGWRARVYLDL